MFLTKKTFKTIISWCLALVVALLCANLVSFFYRSGAGSIQRENAYSGSIRTPNSTIVRGAEGYGINVVDENGYLNDSSLPLAGHYILLMGSSHAEGLQVMQKDTMASVLNRMIDPTERTVYNIGTAGQTFPLIDFIGTIGDVHRVHGTAIFIVHRNITITVSAVDAQTKIAAITKTT